MDYAIHFLMAASVAIYGALAFFQHIILKAFIFFRLKRRHKNIWEHIGSPKIFDSDENIHLIEYLFSSRNEIEEIENNDSILFFLIEVSFGLETFFDKAMRYIIILAIIFSVYLVLKNLIE